MSLTSKLKKIKEKVTKKIKDALPYVKKGKYHDTKESFGNVLEQTNELSEEINELLTSRRELREELARRNGTPLPTGGYSPHPTDSDLVRDLKTENYLLHEVNEALVKEKAELEKIIASLETDKKQQKEEFEKKLVQSQRSIESIEHRLVDCCDKCLAEEEETKENLDKAKKNFFELCEGLGVELSSQLKKDVEKSSTYKELLNNLSKVHSEKMIEMNQKTSEEEVMPTETNQTEVSNSSSQPETNPGVKYFLWITGILALISLILFIIKKGKLRIFKTGKK